MRARSGNGLTVGLDHTAIGSLQSSNDIEQRRFTAAAGADETDELSFSDVEGDIIKGMDVQRTGLEPLRDMFEDELGGYGTCRSCFSRQPSQFSLSMSRDKSGAMRMNPARWAFKMKC